MFCTEIHTGGAVSVKVVIYGSNRLAKACLYCIQNCANTADALFKIQPVNSRRRPPLPPIEGWFCFHMRTAIL